MKNKFIHIISKPFFLALLPLFYFQHAMFENYAPSLVPDFLKLTLLYSGITILLAGVIFLFFRNFTKAALASLTIIALNFFYTSIQNLLTKISGGPIFSKLSILLPISTLFVLIIIYIIAKSNKSLFTFCRYLNFLLFLLIIIDFVQIIQAKDQFQSRLKKHTFQNQNFAKCDTCSHPDIYLIVADEYAGNQELKDIFNYDNYKFDSALTQKGFNVIKNTNANYNSTVYSMGSFFSMNYLNGLNKNLTENYKDILFCRELIKENALTKFLEIKNGYEIHNLSFFDLSDHKSSVQNILTTNTNILAGATLFNKLRNIFGARLVSKQKLEKIKLTELAENLKTELLLKETIYTVNGKPKLVYAHFNMPHWPYFFDSAGNKTPVDSLTEAYKANKQAYIQYLNYTNNKILGLIDDVKLKSNKPPVIMLISDHGFRQLTPGTDKKYYFMNLNAILLPTTRYAGFYEGMSNVNFLRMFMNTQFKQSWPLLPDSSIFIKD